MSHCILLGIPTQSAIVKFIYNFCYCIHYLPYVIVIHNIYDLFLFNLTTNSNNVPTE